MSQLTRLRQLVMKASFSSSSDRHSALEIIDELINQKPVAWGLQIPGESRPRQIWIVKDTAFQNALRRWPEAYANAYQVALCVMPQDESPKTIRLCEFSGDEHHDHDEVGYKKLCHHAGFNHCTLHKLPLTFTHDGWRQCCAPCTTPVQVKPS